MQKTLNSDPCLKCQTDNKNEDCVGKSSLRWILIEVINFNFYSRLGRMQSFIS